MHINADHMVPVEQRDWSVPYAYVTNSYITIIIVVISCSLYSY